MKKPFFLLLLTLLVLSCDTQKKTLDKIDAINKQLANRYAAVEFPEVDRIQLAMDVSMLANDMMTGRETGTKGSERAMEYLEGRFKEMGISSYYADYKVGFAAEEADGYNIVANISGQGVTGEEIVIVGAHYDHIGIKTDAAKGEDNIYNGANDNATGVATVLALANALKAKGKGNRTVVFVLFDAEEKGLIGSQALAKRFKEEGRSVVAVLNFEMLGLPMEQQPFLTYLTGFKKSNMAEVMNQSSNDQDIAGLLPAAEDMNLFMRSDNYPFYQEYQIPSQTFSSFDFNNFDHYHQVGDEASLIDTAHMTKVVEGILPGLYQIINGEPLKIYTNEK